VGSYVGALKNWVAMQDEYEILDLAHFHPLLD
jgi:hypothetical protein